MKKLKRVLCFFMAMSMVVSTAFANTENVASIMRDYQIQVRVQNTSPEIAMKELTNRLINQKISRADLIDYIQATTTPEEFEQFLSMMEVGAEELATKDYLDGQEFQNVLLQVFKSSSNDMGANYNAGQGGGCYSRGFGYVALAVSVVLAVELIQRNVGEDLGWLGDILDTIDLDLGVELGDMELTVATAITGALGIYFVRRC